MEGEKEGFGVVMITITEKEKKKKKEKKNDHNDNFHHYDTVLARKNVSVIRTLKAAMLYSIHRKMIQLARSQGNDTK